VKRFRGGLVFKAHRVVYHSTLGWRVIKKKKKKYGSKICGPRFKDQGRSGGKGTQCFLGFHRTCMFRLDDFLECPGQNKFVEPPAQILSFHLAVSSLRTFLFICRQADSYVLYKKSIRAWK